MNSVIDLLEKTVSEKKDKIAVIYKEDKVTYEELLNKAKMIGDFLSSRIAINEPVMIFMNKSIVTLEAFFGVLYGGGCYSLVNPDFPDKRILQIKETLDNNIILTNDKHYEKAVEMFPDKMVVNLKDINEKVDLKKLERIRKQKTDLDPVYINFTSGSTGIPKGVAICHRSIIDFIEEFTKDLNITEDDIIANQAPFDFDVSVKDIYSSIYKGATLLIVPRRHFSNPTALLDYLDDNKATTLVWAVSALCLITTFHGLDYKVPKSINKVIFSGEVMPMKHLKIWMDKLESATFVNVYGPTEITCNCTYHVIDRKRNYEEIPIGVPFNNEKVFLLDNDKLVEEENKIGEICVAGTCLALGYYNNKEQTNKYFVQNPLNDKYYERIYKTGDLGVYKNGELYFAGRKDFQIKHMGHRIELEEIDKAIMDVKSVIRVCTIYDEDRQKLYGFYIGNIEKYDLKAELEKTLPVYMIPNKLIKMNNFPMTKNGKIDRKALLKSYRELKK